MKYTKWNKHKRFNTNKKTRKKLHGGKGCGCKSLFTGGSYNVVPLNNNMSTKLDPLSNSVASRTANVYKTFGGKYNKKSKKRKSKKIKGGNGYLRQFNNTIDNTLNTSQSFNTLFGYQTLPPSYKLA